MTIKERAEKFYEEYPKVVDVGVGFVSGIVLAKAFMKKPNFNLLNRELFTNMDTGEAVLYVIHGDGSPGRYTFKLVK